MGDQHRRDSELMDVVDEDNLVQFPRQHLIELLKKAVARICFLETKANEVTLCNRCSLSCDNRYGKTDYKDNFIQKSIKRQKYLRKKLAAKEKEVQDYIAQISALRDSIKSNSILSLNNSLQDPSTNILIEKLRQELKSVKTKLKETQNELNSSDFTPNSHTGKILMARCCKLHRENEELRKEISSGRIAKLECELALQKNFAEEIKTSQKEIDGFLTDLDESAEDTKSEMLSLHDQLKKCKITAQNEGNEKMNTKSVSEIKKYTDSSIIDIYSTPKTKTSVLLEESENETSKCNKSKDCKHLYGSKSFQLTEGAHQSGKVHKSHKRKHKSDGSKRKKKHKKAEKRLKMVD